MSRSRLTINSERQSKPLRINRALLAELGILVEEVRKSTGAAAPAADGLLRVRGVIEEEDEREESEEALAALDKALTLSLDEVLRGLAGSRAGEGKALAGVITGAMSTRSRASASAPPSARVAQIGVVRSKFEEPACRSPGTGTALVGGALRPGSGCCWPARPTCARSSTG